jgi:hypothetical protein
MRFYHTEGNCKHIFSCYNMIQMRFQENVSGHPITKIAGSNPARSIVFFSVLEAFAAKSCKNAPVSFVMSVCPHIKNLR